MPKRIAGLLLLVLLITSCDSRTTVKSSDIQSAKNRIKELGKLFVLRSEIIDAEYEIYDVNINNRSIPGPTDRDYRVVLKVKPEDLEKWNDPELSIPSLPLDIKWAEKLASGNQVFDLSGPGMQYSNEHKQMTVFQDSGIILIRIVQH